MKHGKSYGELRFTDDFMFCKIMAAYPDICKEILELLLGFNIKEIRYPEPQKQIEITPDGKGVRFDVYIDDSEGTIYDIEMQTISQPDLSKRSRYYQSMIDLNNIERGSRFSELKKSFVIFICTKQPFSEKVPDLPIYTFRNVCIEDKNIELHDGTTKVFINVPSKNRKIPESIRQFFSYLKGNQAESQLCERIEHSVVAANNHEDWRVEYMTLLERDEQMRTEGGINKVFEFVQDGTISAEKGATNLGLSLDVFLEKMAEAGYKIPALKQKNCFQ